MSPRAYYLLVTVLMMAACRNAPAVPPEDASENLDGSGSVEQSTFRPSKVDILVISSDGDSEGVTLMGLLKGPLLSLLKSVLAPANGSPVQDLHLGAVTSKIDHSTLCPPTDPVKNDGTLLKPIPTSSPWKDYPSNLPWPPPWPFLSLDVIKGTTTFRALAWAYIDGAQGQTQSEEGPCSVTEFLESAALAVDGRNGKFVRDDSLLVILILADYEDCSTKDSSLWDKTDWQKTYAIRNPVCYSPPDGLLFPVSRYPKYFAQIHPKGRTLVAIVGTGGTPKLVPWSGSGTLLAEEACYSSGPSSKGIVPAPRLASFPSEARKYGSGVVEGLMLDGCAAIQGSSASMTPLVDRILELVSR
jgi:hypothetical protein